MDVLIFGGSGFVGQHLARRLQKEGNRALIASRSARQVRYGQVVTYQRDRLAALLETLESDYAIVNLAGESINSGRWTESRKQRILRSRVELTTQLAEAIATVKKKPSVLVNASAVGYYGYSDNATFTEASSSGHGFLSDVTTAWERSALLAEADTRVVLLRLGVVLGIDGGALVRMVLPYRLFAGGPVGQGSQWLSWIHVEDVANLIIHAIQTPTMNGALNATAPNPVTMDQFGRAIGKVLGRPHWLPVPAFAMKLLMGEMAEIVLQGQRVLPEKALLGGYTFLYADVDSALTNLLGAGR
ncbi:MAG: TIGR01777 family oxidoreductase [Clostridia bacterium]